MSFSRVSIPVSRSILTSAKCAPKPQASRFRSKKNSLLKTQVRAARNVSAVRGGGNLAPGNGFVGHSGHREAAVHLNDVLGSRLHQMRGDPARLFNDAIGRNRQGAAAQMALRLPNVPAACWTTSVSPCRIAT